MALNRAVAIPLLEKRLKRDSWPRFQMALIVSLTGASGWVGSFLLLHLGVGQMAVRYPLALAGAYACFLGMLWIWLRTKTNNFTEIPELSSAANSVPAPIASPSVPLAQVPANQFANVHGQAPDDRNAEPVASRVSTLAMREIGRAENKWMSAANSTPASVFSGSSTDSGSSSGSSSSSSDLDQLLVPLIVILMAVGLALASLYVVYLAPGLFAEMLFDTAMSYKLYRHLSNTDDSPSWISTAVRKTITPFLITGVFLVVAGYMLSSAAPGARTLGEALSVSANP